MPSITPAQRVFGIGVQPLEKMFRPPAGMEYDPAYNDFGRRTWAQEDMNDAQRESVLAQTELARAQRDQLKADLATRGAEDAAFAEMKKRPDEIPNILRSFPELARSKNFDNVLQYAQAVDPNAAQKTLSASLRSRLKPHELRYYDQHFGTHGDALAASDFAKLQGEHENGLVDMMKSGVPLDVIDKYRDRPLSPLERETLIQQHTKKPVNDLSPLMKSGMEELMKLEAAGDAAGAARLNNFLVNQGLHINKAAKIIPVPESTGEEEDALTASSSTTLAGKRGSKVNPAFEEYRKLYQNALEREAKAREEASKADEFPLKDANGNVIPPKAPPQPHELESSKIVQQALQHLNYDPRSNTLIPAIREPIAGANPQAFAQSALSVANLGNRIVSPVDYSAVEMEPYANIQTPEFSGLPQQRFNQVAPAGAVEAPASSQAPAIEQQIDLSKVPFSEIESTVQKAVEKSKEEESINKAWYNAQMELQKKLEKEFPGNFKGTNYSKLRRFAEAVVGGELETFNPTGNPEFEITGPVGVRTLKKLGLSPSGEAFSEPGNRRVGTQKVTYDKLLKTWAKNYLGLAPVTSVPQVPALPAKKADILDSLLDSSMKASDS